MKKGFVFIVALSMILSISCDENSDDRIHINHRLIIHAELSNSGYYSYLNFSWDDVPANNYNWRVLIRTDEVKEIEFYELAIEYLLYGDEEEFEWLNNCRFYGVYSGDNTYDVGYYSEDQYYYKLLAYNQNGVFILSNTIHI